MRPPSTHDTTTRGERRGAGAWRWAAGLAVAATFLALLLPARQGPGARRSCGGVMLPPGPDERLFERRAAARGEVVEGMLAGELSLLQAAAAFRRIAEYPFGPPTTLEPWPGDSEGERICRQVIDWAGTRLARMGGGAEEVEVVLARLRLELRRLLDDGGGVIELPPVD